MPESELYLLLFDIVMLKLLFSTDWHNLTFGIFIASYMISNSQCFTRVGSSERHQIGSLHINAGRRRDQCRFDRGYGGTQDTSQEG